MNDDLLKQAEAKLAETMAGYGQHISPTPLEYSWSVYNIPKVVSVVDSKKKPSLHFGSRPRAEEGVYGQIINKYTASPSWYDPDEELPSLTPIQPNQAYDIKEAVDSEIGWLEEYQQNIMSNNNSKKKRSNRRLAKSNFRNAKFTAEQLLKTFDKMVEKEVGNIAITGSLALFLQGKITRNIFGDLDILVRSGEVQLDDEFEDVQMDMGYDPNNSLVATPKIYYYNESLIDVFPVETQTLDTVDVEYLGKAYLCVHYKHILDAKLKMILPKMKDYRELYNSCFEMNIL